MTHPFVVVIREHVEGDDKARRRGVSHITMWPADHRLIGEPNSVRCNGKLVPITPTGRRQGRFRWYYAKGVRR